MRERLFGLFILAATAAGCGGMASSTGPSGSAAVKSVALNIPAFVLLGSPAQATATAFLSDGTTSTTGITFTSDTTTVATVTAAGLVAGVSAGSVTIHASIQGLIASQTIRIEPDYRGTWTGATGSVTCRVVSGPSDSCTPLSGIVSGPLSLVITTQTNDTVSGTLSNLNLGTDGANPALTLSFPITGSTAVNGALSLRGTATDFAEGFFDLQNWQTSLTPAGALSGTCDLVINAITEEVLLTITMPGLTRL